MKLIKCLTIIFAASLAGCARHAAALNSGVLLPLSYPVPKINNPARLVKQENALSRWLVVYEKCIKRKL